MGNLKAVGLENKDHTPAPDVIIAREGESGEAEFVQDGIKFEIIVRSGRHLRGGLVSCEVLPSDAKNPTLFTMEVDKTKSVPGYGFSLRHDR